VPQKKCPPSLRWFDRDLGQDFLINSLRDVLRTSGGMSRKVIGKRFWGYSKEKINVALALLERRGEAGARARYAAVLRTCAAAAV
jgi:hypothetical protein